MLIDDAVFLPTLAFLYWAKSGQAFTPPTDEQIAGFDPEHPEDLATATGMTHLGHTDLDEDIEGDEEGGDSEVRGTRQKPNLRERVEPVVDYFTVNLVQFTPTSLDLYYGPGGSSSGGRFVAPSGYSPTEGTLLLVYCDGSRNLGELLRKVSARRGGPLGREAENFLRLPIRFTPLATTGAGTEWINETLFTLPAPTGLAAGTATATTVPLTWNAVTGAETYQVQRSTDGGATWTAVTAGAGGTPSTASTSVTGLTTATTYHFRVAGVDASSEVGAWSPAVPVTTA